ncbi:MAG: hypothetical protein V1887_00940 [Candidatus Aenigmatarchaeota archaeon]
MEPAEFILKILILCTLCFGILGMIVQSAQFEGVVISQEKQRVAVDMGNAFSAAPCLTEHFGTEGRKGLFVEQQLDTLSAGNMEPCVSMEGVWSVIVTGDGKSWTFGSKDTMGSPAKRTFPVAIRKNDGSVVPGMLEVNVGVVG